MTDVSINILGNRHRFVVGDKVKGSVSITVPHNVPISNVTVSFHCLGEVKWVEYPGTPYYLNGFVYYDKYSYLEKVLSTAEAGVKVIPKNTLTTIPFEYTIPKE